MAPCRSEAPVRLEVRGRPDQSFGTLRLGQAIWPCALGRAGIVREKREGDGATPAGRFSLRRVFYRPDRMLAPPSSGLPVGALSPADGWCDDLGSAEYNRPVTLPHAARCERLWRDDGLYDVLAEIGYNDDPVRMGAGSAIFLHVAKAQEDRFAPTEGCVALEKMALLAVLEGCGHGAAIDIGLI